MLAIHVGGKRVGTLSDLERILTGLVRNQQRAEVRDDTGKTVGWIDPHIKPDDPHVVHAPAVTR